MRRFAILAVVAITLVTSGCATAPASSQNAMRCSGRISKDNGHVTRNEEDCEWGNKYSSTPPQPVYVVQQPVYAPQQALYAPQYMVAPPPLQFNYVQPYPMFRPPVFNIGGVRLNNGGFHGRR